MGKYDFKCALCRDEGTEEGCSRCGKVKTEELLSARKDISLANIKSVHIPTHYLNSNWDETILIKDKDAYTGDETFNTYLKQLSMVYRHLETGGLMRNSALIASPIGFGKTTWAYNCMRELIKSNYNICPLLDTSQLKSLQTLYYEKPTWTRDWCGYTYTDYINSDVLFISVTKSPEYIYAARLIIDIVDTRSKLSKPTIVLSDWPISSLQKSDSTGMLTSMLRGGSNANPYKFLIPVTFTAY